MNGVPTITTPFFGDQITNADRFEELGCGIQQSFLKSQDCGHGGFDGMFFDPVAVTAESLAESVRRLLEEPQWLINARSLRDRQKAECGQALSHKIEMMVAAVERQASNL
jgi:UDP:flavonoid glycosyltransferase YjiC (YdhE family)